MRPLLEQTIAAAESAKENAARFRRSELAGLRIGLPADISARLIAAPLREMIRRIPKLEIELKMAEKEQMAEGLLQGEIDTAFLDDSIELPDRLNAWPLFQEGYQLAFPAAHRFAKLNGLGLEALDGEVLLCRHSSIAASSAATALPRRWEQSQYPAHQRERGTRSTAGGNRIGHRSPARAYQRFAPAVDPAVSQYAAAAVGRALRGRRPALFTRT